MKCIFCFLVLLTSCSSVVKTKGTVKGEYSLSISSLKEVYTDENCIIKGTVFDKATEEPLDYVYVELIRNKGEKESQQILTAEDGFFKFITVEGKYIVKASFEDDKVITRKINCKRNTETDITFLLGYYYIY